MTEAHRYVRSVAPTLILVPNALIDTWITEVEKHFGDSLTLIIFFDSNTGDRRRKLVELQKPLDKLDLTVPSTGTTVILSSYQTWARRTTREIDLEQRMRSILLAFDLGTTLRGLATMREPRESSPLRQLFCCCSNQTRRSSNRETNKSRH
jgi:SNF2 family DNA or RNA helicase